MTANVKETNNNDNDNNNNNNNNNNDLISTSANVSQWNTSIGETKKI